MNDREQIAELEAKVERLERDLGAIAGAPARRRWPRATVRLPSCKETSEQLKRLQGRRAVRIAPATFAPHATGRSVVIEVSSDSPIARPSARDPPDVDRGCNERDPKPTCDAHRRSGAGRRDPRGPARGTRVVHGPARVDRHPEPRRREACSHGASRHRQTAYRDVEIIVVDNGSTDGSPDRADAASSSHSRSGSSGTTAIGRSPRPMGRGSRRPGELMLLPQQRRRADHRRLARATWWRR